jgi:hypothetical protein
MVMAPTEISLPFIFSNCFEISYTDNSDLAEKQKYYEEQFRDFTGNPDNYNCEWSFEFSDIESANNARITDINALENNGKIIQTPMWP